MRLTGKTAGYLVAGIGWATLAFGLALEQAGLRAGTPVATIGGWTIASGLALAVIAATEHGFGALDRFFGEILARTRRAAPRVEPTFDAVAEPPPTLAAPPARAAEEAPRRLTQQTALAGERQPAPRAPVAPAPPRALERHAPARAMDRRAAPQEMDRRPAPHDIDRRAAPQDMDRRAAPLEIDRPPPRACAAYFEDDEDETSLRAFEPAPQSAHDVRIQHRAGQDRSGQDAWRQDAWRQDAWRQDAWRQDASWQESLAQEPARRESLRRESLRQEASRQDAASPRADAYPLDAPQPPRPPRAEAAAPPPRLPRALPPAEAAPAPPSFDEMLDLAAQETRAARAEPDPRPAPAPKPAYHPAPSSPANLDAPRRAPAVADAARASVIEEGEIAGHPYRVLADLTVEIDTVLGARAFESMEAARRFVGAPAARARSVA